MKRGNIPEFDVMRAVAILIILFHHLPEHSANFYNLHSFGLNDFSYVNVLNRYFALGIFIFISGFVLSKTNRGLETSKGVRNFIVKRYIRIIPLYLIAFLMFLKIFGNLLAPMTPFSFIVHILGLQILFASKYCEPVFTLWFVGLIMAYYFVFVVLERFGKQMISLLTLSIIIPLISILLIYYFGIIDKNFVLYFGVFIAGIICAKYDILDKIKTYHIGLGVVAFLVSTYTYSFFIYPAITVQGAKPSLFSNIGLAAFLLTNIIMLSTVLIAYKLARCIVGTGHYHLLKMISYASYSIFLFHRPLWWLMALIYTPENSLFRIAYMILLGIPIIIGCSYYIQKGYDTYPAKYLSKLLIN